MPLLVFFCVAIIRKLEFTSTNLTSFQTFYSSLRNHSLERINLLKDTKYINVYKELFLKYVLDIGTFEGKQNNGKPKRLHLFRLFRV
jgi:hypothetical protein